MSHLLHVLGALLALAAAESGLASGAERPLGVLALLALPHALGAAAHALGRRGRFARAQALAHVLERSAPLAYAGCVLLCGWRRTVAVRLGLDPDLLGWPGPGLFAALAPYAALELLAIDARARLHASTPDARRGLAAFERRMFASSFLPFLAYVVLAALAGASDRLRVPLEEVGLLDTLFTLLTLGAFLALLPALLRRTWSTAPLPPGGLRAMLEEVARRAGFRYRELCVWITGGRMANAAILGLGARQRTVLLSDALLVELAPREVAAVFAHEMGHALRRHAPFSVVTLALVFFALKLAVRALPAGPEGLDVALLAVLLGLWALGFGWLSRRFELEADLVSLETIGDPTPLSDALTKVGGAHAHRRSSWRHFSNERRIAFLERAARDPAVGRRLRAKLARARALFAVLCALAIVAEGVFLVRDLPRERVVVALRLGAFASARERGLAADDLAPLVARSAALADGALPEAIEEAARRALSAGDARAADELVALARLRGGPDALADVAELLERLERDGAAQEPEALPEAWRDALRAWRERAHAGAGT